MSYYKVVGFLVLGLLVGGSGSMAQGIEESSSSGTIKNIDALEVLFTEHQYRFLPIGPPSEDVLVQQYGPVIPVDWNSFPESFKKGMYAEMDDRGYPVYSILVYEDPWSREIVFLNSYDTEVYRLAAQPGYDPLAWQKTVFNLESGEVLDDFSQWIYDPAHVAARFELIPEIFYEGYLAEQQSISQMMAFAPMSMMLSQQIAIPTNLFIEIQASTNGMVELGLYWPSNFVHKLELFSSTNLVAGNWEVILTDIITAGETNYCWIDTASSNTFQKYYQTGNAELNSDSDSISDAREIILYGTSVNDSDTDHDNLDDDVEIAYGTDPLDPNNELATANLPDLETVEPTNGYPSSFVSFDPPVSNTWYVSPVIAEWTRTATSNETVVITSAEEIEAMAIYASATNLAGITWQTNYGHAQMPADGFTLIWPVTGVATGMPIRINGTEAWWISGACSTGESFSVFGRNLGADCYAYIDGYGWITNSSCNPYKADFIVPTGLSNGTYAVYLHNGEGGKYGWSKPLSLSVQVLQNWPAAIIDVTQPPYNATGNGVSNDYQAIIDAIGDCPSNGTVYFPAGRYAVGSKIWKGVYDRRLVGDGPTNSVITTLASSSGFPTIGMFHNDFKNAEVRDLGFSSGAGHRGMVLRCRDAENVRFVNCRFDDLDGSPGDYTPTLDMETGAGLSFENCDIITYRGCNFNGNTELTFKNCNFRAWGDSAAGYMFIAGGVDNMRVEECTATHYDASDYTNSRGWCQGRFIVLEGNGGANRNTYIGGCTTTDMAPRWDWTRDRYEYEIDGNGVTNYYQAHQNAGEQILAEHQRVRLRYAIDSATSNTVESSYMVVSGQIGDTINALSPSQAENHPRTIASINYDSGEYTVSTIWLAEQQPDIGDSIVINGTTGIVVAISADTLRLSYNPVGMVATVVAGKGLGQSRVVTATERQTAGAITVDSPWNVVPDSSSTISIGHYVHRLAVVGNHFDGLPHTALLYDQGNNTAPYDIDTAPTDTASCGVSLYGGASDCVIYSNRVTDIEAAVLFWGYDDSSTPEISFDTVQPNYFNMALDNTVSNCRLGVSAIIYDHANATNQPDTALLGNTVRDNHFDRIHLDVFSIGYNNDFPVEMTVWEHNSAENVQSNVWGSYGGVNTYTNNNVIY